MLKLHFCIDDHAPVFKNYSIELSFLLLLYTIHKDNINIIQILIIKEKKQNFILNMSLNELDEDWTVLLKLGQAFNFC